MLLSAKRRAYFCKSIAIEMGGVQRYISEVSGSGVGVTLLNLALQIGQRWAIAISKENALWEKVA